MVIIVLVFFRQSFVEKSNTIEGAANAANVAIFFPVKTRATIKKINKNGLSFSWISGSCESLGPTKGKSDAACHARLWVKIGGSWSGGKFDWISTSRTSRDFKNIYSGYNGWSSSMLSKASEFGFDIYHPGTKKKTNRATCPGWH